MKRAIFLVLALFYDIIITMIAKGAGLTATGDYMIEIPEDPTFLDTFVEGFDVFWDLLTFNITGDIPDTLILILVYLPNVAIFIVIITLIFNRN